MQTSDENKTKYQSGDYKLMQYQILQTNITKTVWQTVRRITNEILVVKGLRTKRVTCKVQPSVSLITHVTKTTQQFGHWSLLHSARTA